MATDFVDTEAIVQRAIEQWAALAFAPHPPEYPSLAHYITASLRGQTPGASASHSIITPECRMNRGDDGAWTEAVIRARAEYDAIVDGWKKMSKQPTLHLLLTIERP